jgi:hypothetical protein
MALAGLHPAVMNIENNSPSRDKDPCKQPGNPRSLDDFQGHP